MAATLPDADDGPVTARVVGRPKVGNCHTCGHRPVAFGAKACPKCGARNPNPGVADRFVGRGLVAGLAIGAVAGGLLGGFAGNGGPGGAIAGMLLGAVVGFCAGFLIGLVAAVFASVFGVR